MDYYLKAANESAMWTALVSAGAAKQIEVKDSEGTVVETRFVPTEGYSIDIVGTVYKPTGNMVQQTVNELTVEVPEMAALEGFHANLRGPADLAEKVEYVPYQPTETEQMDPEFVMPEPEEIRTPSPLADLLVYPKTPSRVWF